MILAECIVVAVLVLLVWSLVASAATQHPVIAQVQTTDSPTDSSTRSPEVPGVTRSAARAQLPGLNLDAGFWRVRLGQLNRDQVTIEQLEWHLVHNAMDTMHRYVETVVLPSMMRAEKLA
jgi:hypothetical protein